MQLLSDIIKDVIFFAATFGGMYLFMQIISKIAKKYNFELDRFGLICLSIGATGSAGWLLFIIYFAITV